METVELFGRLFVSLVVVGGLVLLGRRLLANGGLGDRGEPQLEIVARRQVGRQSSLMLVRCGARTLLLGADGERLSFLAEGDDLDDNNAPAAITDGRELASLGVPTRDRERSADAVLSVDEILHDLGADSLPTDRHPTDSPTTSASDDAAATLRLDDLEAMLQQPLDARTRQRRSSPASPRMSVIEALREATVRRT